LNPRSAFSIGFVRVLGNPGVFLFWIFLAAYFKAHDWVEPTLKGTLWCVAGVAGGTSVWFCGLSYAVSRGHGKFTEKTLLRMENISGICLLLMAIGQGVHIIWQMTHHKL
jgi:threonine/homoserine/homoserine lactone efflux protein